MLRSSGQGVSVCTVCAINSLTYKLNGISWYLGQSRRSGVSVAVTTEKKTKKHGCSCLWLKCNFADDNLALVAVQGHNDYSHIAHWVSTVAGWGGDQLAAANAPVAQDVYVTLCYFVSMHLCTVFPLIETRSQAQASEWKPGSDSEYHGANGHCISHDALHTDVWIMACKSQKKHEKLHLKIKIRSSAITECLGCFK